MASLPPGMGRRAGGSLQLRRQASGIQAGLLYLLHGDTPPFLFCRFRIVTNSVGNPQQKYTRSGRKIGLQFAKNLGRIGMNLGGGVSNGICHQQRVRQLRSLRGGLPQRSDFRRQRAFRDRRGVLRRLRRVRGYLPHGRDFPGLSYVTQNGPPLAGGGPFAYPARCAVCEIETERSKREWLQA